MTIDEMINKLETLSIEKYKKAVMLDEVVNKKQIIDMCDIDLIEATLCRQKSDDYEQLSEWLKELKAHREAWTVVANAMKECSYKIWHEFGEYIGEDCEQLEIVNLKTALDILEDCRPKEGRLKELQTDRSNLTSQSLSDLLVHCENENERLHDRTNELEKELQAHREAWEKILDEMMDVSIPGQDAEYVYQNIYDIIRQYRPKDGDTK